MISTIMTYIIYQISLSSFDRKASYIETADMSRVSYLRCVFQHLFLVCVFSFACLSISFFAEQLNLFMPNVSGSQYIHSALHLSISISLLQLHTLNFF